MLPRDEFGQVIGGRPVDPKVWPATFIFRNMGGGGCTATAIGPRAIVTAAHCMENAAQAFIVTGSGSSGTVTCNHHPKYLDDISADFALCLSSIDLTKPASGFERINRDANLVREQQEVRLLGYGCLTPGGSDHNFGALFEGDAKISKTTVQNPNYIVTNGGAAVCFGDSGGGAYVRPTGLDTSRRLIAINSRGDISVNSWLSVVHKPDFIDWATKWAKTNAVLICGIHDDATCHQ